MLMCRNGYVAIRWKEEKKKEYRWFIEINLKNKLTFIWNIKKKISKILFDFY
jgi:hypothetical protein